MSNQKERILIPFAGRMKFARMLKSKGCDIPDMYGTKMSQEGKFDFFLFWKDSEGRDHRAWYTSFKHAPYLEIDEVVTPPDRDGRDSVRTVQRKTDAHRGRPGRIDFAPDVGGHPGRVRRKIQNGS